MSESEIITYQGKMFRKTGEVRSPRQGDFYLCGKRGNHVQASSDHPLCAASKYPILAELPAEPAQSPMPDVKSSGFDESIGNPSVSAIVHAAERFNKSSQSFADDLWDDLGLLHLNIEMTRGDWIRAIAPKLRQFTEGEIAWRSAGTPKEGQ